jgi:hypothetical protein
MHTQKNPFKAPLMALAAVGLLAGALTLSAQANDEDKTDDKKFNLDHYACYEVKERDYNTAHETTPPDTDDGEKVVLYNQFEWGTPVYVGELKLLCVPTHKEHHKDDEPKDDEPKDDDDKKQ